VTLFVLAFLPSLTSNSTDGLGRAKFTELCLDNEPVITTSGHGTPSHWGRAVLSASPLKLRDSQFDETLDDYRRYCSNIL